MNILGVGGSEFLIVLLIMLVIAGPKRMIHWSYILGKHMSKFRRMWTETVDIVQQEFDEAGVGIQLPKEVPTRGSLQKQAGKVVGGVTAPMQDTLKEVDTQLGEIKTATRETATSTNSVVRGSNGAQKAPDLGLAGKPASQPTPAATPVGATSVASAATTSAPARRKEARRADDEYGAWSSHEPAQVGAWARESAPPETEEEV